MEERIRAYSQAWLGGDTTALPPVKPSARPRNRPFSGLRRRMNRKKKNVKKGVDFSRVFWYNSFLSGDQ